MDGFQNGKLSELSKKLAFWCPFVLARLGGSLAALKGVSKRMGFKLEVSEL